MKLRFILLAVMCVSLLGQDASAMKRPTADLERMECIDNYSKALVFGCVLVYFWLTNKGEESQRKDTRAKTSNPNLKSLFSTVERSLE